MTYLLLISQNTVLILATIKNKRHNLMQNKIFYYRSLPSVIYIKHTSVDYINSQPQEGFDPPWVHHKGKLLEFAIHNPTKPPRLDLHLKV